jgi:hypothetical protein
MHSTAKKPLNERGIGPLDRLLKKYHPQTASPSKSTPSSARNIQQSRSSTVSRLLSSSLTGIGSSIPFTPLDKGKGRAVPISGEIILIDSDEEASPRKLYTPSTTINGPGGNTSGLSKTVLVNRGEEAVVKRTEAIRPVAPARKPAPFPLPPPSPEVEEPPRSRPHHSSSHRPTTTKTPSSSAKPLYKTHINPSSRHGHPGTSSSRPKPPDSDIKPSTRLVAAGTSDRPIDLISNSTASSGPVLLETPPKANQPIVPQYVLDEMRNNDKRGAFGAHKKREIPALTPMRSSQNLSPREGVSLLDKGKGRERENYKQKHAIGVRTSTAAPKDILRDRSGRDSNEAQGSRDGDRTKHPLPARPQTRVEELRSPRKGEASMQPRTAYALPNKPVNAPMDDNSADLRRNIASPERRDRNQPKDARYQDQPRPMKRPAPASSSSHPPKRPRVTLIPPSMDEESYRPALPQHIARLKNPSKRASTLSTSSSRRPDRPARARPETGAYTIPTMETPIHEWPSQRGSYGDAVKRGMIRSATVGVGPTKKDVQAVLEKRKDKEKEKREVSKDSGRVTSFRTSSSLTPLSSSTSLNSLSSPPKVKLGSLAEMDEMEEVEQIDLVSNSMTGERNALICIDGYVRSLCCSRSR